jgi:hypothetical protein
MNTQTITRLLASGMVAAQSKYQAASLAFGAATIREGIAINNGRNTEFATGAETQNTADMVGRQVYLRPQIRTSREPPSSIGIEPLLYLEVEVWFISWVDVFVWDIVVVDVIDVANADVVDAADVADAADVVDVVDVADVVDVVDIIVIA